MVAKALNAQPGDGSRGYKQIASVAKEQSLGNQVKSGLGKNERNSKYLEYSIHMYIP